MSDDGLARIAAELCAVPPADFTAARTAAAAAAAGDLAKQVKKLRKPVLAAWVVNVFAQTDADALAPAAALAEQVRDALAEADAAAVTQLGRQRRGLVRELVAAALSRAAEEGVDIGPAAREGVEQTLDAATRDPDAAAAVATGRLLRPIQATGMEPPDLTDAVSGPFTPPSGAPAAPTDELAERRGRREAARAARDAERAAETAAAERERAEKRWHAARERAAVLEERLLAIETERDRLAAEADAAQQEADARAADLEEARGRERAARRAAGQASADRG